MEAPTYSVEVITLPVSDVERALRFYVDQVGFTVDVDYSPNEGFRVVQLTPTGSRCSLQIGNGLTDAPVGSPRNVYLVVRDLEAARSRLLERRGRRRCDSAQNTPWSLGRRLRTRSRPRARRLCQLCTGSPIRMETAGCYRNGATAMCDAALRRK